MSLGGMRARARAARAADRRGGTMRLDRRQVKCKTEDQGTHITWMSGELRQLSPKLRGKQDASGSCLISALPTKAQSCNHRGFPSSGEGGCVSAAACSFGPCMHPRTQSVLLVMRSTLRSKMWGSSCRTNQDPHVIANCQTKNRTKCNQAWLTIHVPCPRRFVSTNPLLQDCEGQWYSTTCHRQSPVFMSFQSQPQPPKANIGEIRRSKPFRRASMGKHSMVGRARGTQTMRCECGVRALVGLLCHHTGFEQDQAVYVVGGARRRRRGGRNRISSPECD